MYLTRYYKIQAKYIKQFKVDKSDNGKFRRRHKTTTGLLHMHLNLTEIRL